MKIDFEHKQSAHCENGVTTNLLHHIGVEQISEPLAFGIGAGIFYIHIPFMMINNGPALAFRSMPGSIFKKTCNSLGIPVVRETFNSKEKAQRVLDLCLEKGQPVGCQVGVYYLTYYPKEYRFHFNAHNLIVYGKENDNYLISDPVMEKVTSLSTYELERVRFAKGALAPNGQLYYPKEKREITDDLIRKAIKSGIKSTVFDMTGIPGSFVGVNGIKYTGNKIKTWREKLGLKTSGLYLAQLVRMQEEIGTGGGGFRFMYGAFLQQAYKYHRNDQLLEISKQFTKSGDLWRSAAVQAAGIYKGRLSSQQDFNDMGDYLLEIFEVEKAGYKALAKLNLN